MRALNTVLPDWTGAALLWAIAAIPIIGFTKNLWPRRLALLSILTAALYVGYLAFGGRELAP